MTYLSVLVAALVYQRRAVVAAHPWFGPELAFMVLLAAGNALTVLTNGNSMWDEDKLEPGLSLYGWIANTGDDVLTFAVPLSAKHEPMALQNVKKQRDPYNPLADRLASRTKRTR